jgi:hypothetical protein
MFRRAAAGGPLPRLVVHVFSLGRCFHCFVVMALRCALGPCRPGSQSPCCRHSSLSHHSRRSRRSICRQLKLLVANFLVTVRRVESVDYVDLKPSVCVCVCASRVGGWRSQRGKGREGERAQRQRRQGVGSGDATAAVAVPAAKGRNCCCNCCSGACLSGSGASRRGLAMLLQRLLPKMAAATTVGPSARAAARR